MLRIHGKAVPMLVFVDESGDTGLKLNRGSSPLLTVALVLFEDREEAARCDQSIVELRKRSDRKRREYRFSSCNHATRIRFLRCAQQHTFVYSAIAIDKTKLYGEGFKYHSSFMKLAIRYAFAGIKERLDRATVVFDSHGGRDFTTTLQTYLKRELNDPTKKRVRKVRPKPSDRDNLVQLADMVCGSVARSFDTSRGPRRSEYRGIIRAREAHVQYWPR